MDGIIGKKIGMTQLLVGQRAIPATVIHAGPCFVVGVRTKQKDGYCAVQLAYGEGKGTNRPMSGVFKRASVTPKKYITEFRTDDSAGFKLGQKITVEIFREGEKVNITGFSKGKGFTGVAKRHGFSGGPKTHGSMSHAVPGSIGASANPARVTKGQKLPGRMGNKRVTVKNLEILKIDQGQDLMVVKGPISGPRRGYLFIRKSQR